MPSSDRDMQILRLIERYGLITAEVLSATLFAGLTEKAVERVITRLLAEERLRSQPLVGRRCFYTLTPKSGTDLGLDGDQFAMPMGAQGLLQNLAMLNFCQLEEPRHERLLLNEFLSRFPSLAVRGMIGPARRTRYYLDNSDKARGCIRLGLMIPDLGSHPRRLARKIRREVEKRRAAHEQVAALIRDQLVTVACLTAWSDKACHIDAMLKKEPFHFRSVVVPGMAELLIFTRKSDHASESTRN